MRILRYVAAIGLAPFLLVSFASAQIASFSLTHNGWTYNERDLIGDGARVGGGDADFINPFGVDNLFQNWWWYNTDANGREFALGNQVSGSQTSPNSARVTYVESAGPNAPGALQFDLEYTLTALPGGNSAFVQIGFKIHNLSNTTQSLNFFSYSDFDLNGTPGNDTGVFIAPNQFALADANPLVSGGLIASNTGQVGWEQSFFPDLRGKLTDADLDTLANATSPLTGDLTNGFMWHIDLAPNGSSNGTDQFVGSLLKYVTNPVPEPTSFAVLAIAAGAMLARRRRR